MTGNEEHVSRSLMDKYVRREASKEEQFNIAEHMYDCNGCRRRLTQLEFIENFDEHWNNWSLEAVPSVFSGAKLQKAIVYLSSYDETRRASGEADMCGIIERAAAEPEGLSDLERAFEEHIEIVPYDDRKSRAEDFFYQALKQAKADKSE